MQLLGPPARVGVLEKMPARVICSFAFARLASFMHLAFGSLFSLCSPIEIPL